MREGRQEETQNNNIPVYIDPLISATGISLNLYCPTSQTGRNHDGTDAHAVRLHETQSLPADP